jgi:hypothetical protein
LERPKEAAEALEYFLANKQGGPGAFDLGSYGFRHHVGDLDVIAGLKARSLAAQDLPTPAQVLEHMASTNGWTNVGIDILARLTVDEYVALFKSIRGSTLRQSVETLRGIESMDLKDKRYAYISENTRQALTILFKESPLNAVRLRSLGFIPLPDPESGMPS